MLDHNWFSEVVLRNKYDFVTPIHIQIKWISDKDVGMCSPNK